MIRPDAVERLARRFAEVSASLRGETVDGNEFDRMPEWQQAYYSSLAYKALRNIEGHA